MNTIFRQNTILYKCLLNSPLKQAVSGSLYKLVRPNGSKAEDIVINSIDLTGETVLRGASNVNIYVPTITSGKASLPDTERMEVLTIKALETLKEGFGPDYNFWCDTQRVIEEKDANDKVSYYVNLRIEFKFHNSQPVATAQA